MNKIYYKEIEEIKSHYEELIRYQKIKYLETLWNAVLLNFDPKTVTVFHPKMLLKFKNRLNELKIDKKKIYPFYFSDLKHFTESRQYVSLNMFLLEEPNMEDFLEFVNEFTIQQITDNKSYLKLINTFLNQFSLSNKFLKRSGVFYLSRLIQIYEKFIDYLNKYFDPNKPYFYWSKKSFFDKWSKKLKNPKICEQNYSHFIAMKNSEIHDQMYNSVYLIDQDKNMTCLDWFSLPNENENLKSSLEKYGILFTLEYLDIDSLIAF